MSCTWTTINETDHHTMGLLDLLKRSSKDPKERFWTWFEKNKGEVGVVLVDQAKGMAAYQRLTAEIQRVNEHIVPELMGDADGTNVLIISADGKREAVQAVIDLAEAAPQIGGWRVERFRRPAPEGMRIVYQGLDIDPANVRVAYNVDEAKPVVHVAVLLPGYTEIDKRFLGVGFLYLDHTIGEYNTIMHVGQIKFMAPEDVPPMAELLTLTELRKLIEAKFY